MIDDLPLAERLKEIDEESEVLHKRIEELAAERAFRVSTAAAHKRRSPTEIREAVLAEFHRPGIDSLGAAYIALRIEATMHTVANTLSWLLTKGHIELLDNGYWRLKNPAAVSAAKPAIPEGSDPVLAEPSQETEE